MSDELESKIDHNSSNIYAIDKELMDIRNNIVLIEEKIDLKTTFTKRDMNIYISWPVVIVFIMLLISSCLTFVWFN